MIAHRYRDGVHCRRGITCPPLTAAGSARGGVGGTAARAGGGARVRATRGRAPPLDHSIDLVARRDAKADDAAE